MDAMTVRDDDDLTCDAFKKIWWARLFSWRSFTHCPLPCATALEIFSYILLEPNNNLAASSHYLISGNSCMALLAGRAGGGG